MNQSIGVLVSVRAEDRVTPAGLAALFAVAALLWCSPSWSEEARCSELGSACVCSEPLNNNDDLGTGNSGSHDPTDSKSKECGTGSFIYVPDQTKMVADTATDAGVDLPGVDYVIQHTVPPGISNWNIPKSADTDFTGCTIAVRWYRQLSKGWPRDIHDKTTGDNDIKAMRLSGIANHQSVFLARASSADGWHWINTMPSAEDPNGLTINQYFQHTKETGEGSDFDDLLGNWVRHEVAFDHNPNGGNHLRFRVRSVKIGDTGGGVLGEVGRRELLPASNGMLSTSTYSTADAVGSSQSGFKIIAWSMPSWVDAFPTGEKQWSSHIMWAKVCEGDEGVGTIPADRQNFWIGPAYEIEGDVATFPSGSGTPNSGPTVTITAPLDGATSNEGDALNLTGTGTDSEDGDLSASIIWTSDVDGALGTGASIAPVLTPGSHTITAEVSDSGALVGTDSISVVVNAATSSTTPGGIPGSGTILFEESFDDTDFSSRGWYDNRPNPVITTAEHVAGSLSSFECTFAAGANGCSGGRPARHKFPDTESVYLSFWLKFSDSWVVDDGSPGMHLHHFISNLDDDYVGPANTFLTAYADVYRGHALVAVQDSKNVDNNCIRQGNGVVVGCNGDFNSYPFTEQRSVATCNGLVGEVDFKTCYDTGSYWYSHRGWHSDVTAFSDADKNSWHFVEVYMEMNSIQNGIGVPDGKIRWVQDGQTLISSDQILFRTGANATMMFNQYTLSPYIGTGAPVQQTLWIDDLTVATARPSQGDPLPEPDPVPAPEPDPVPAPEPLSAPGQPQLISP